MPTYFGTSDYDHRTPERVGVLLVNLGTPENPSVPAVRRYLAEFLADPRVIEYPRLLWRAVLHGVILRIRPQRSAHAYAQIWTPQGSPLMVHTLALAEKLGTELQTALQEQVPVIAAMTYGEPSIRAGLEQLHALNVRKLIVLPLYPQYSGSTTGAVFDAVTRVLQSWRWVPELHFITQYHDNDHYVAALAESVKAHWRTHERNHLLLSFHGLPKRYLLNGDPYHCQCFKTARLLAEQLHLRDDEWSVSFQSRVGREEWLRPYTEETLRQYAQSSPKRVTVMCPGFAVDCLETLEEIALRNKADFMAAGGEHYDYVPALNDDDAHVALLASLVRRHAQPWLPLEERGASAERARQRGAKT